MPGCGDKCPRLNPLLLNFKFRVQDSSASRPGRHSSLLRMHWPNVRMAFRDLPSNDSNPKQFLQHRTLHAADLFPVLDRKTQKQCESRVQTNQGTAVIRHFQCSFSCGLSVTVSPLCRTDCNLFDLLLEDD